MNENAEKLPQRRYTEIVATAGNLAFMLGEVRKTVLNAILDGKPCLENQVFEDLEATFSKLGERDREDLGGKYLALRSDLANRAYDWALASLDDYTDGLKDVIVLEAREAYARENPGKDLPKELL